MGGGGNDGFRAIVIVMTRAADRRQHGASAMVDPLEEARHAGGEGLEIHIVIDGETTSFG